MTARRKSGASPLLVVVLGVVLVVAVVLLAKALMTPDAAQVRDAADATARELERTPVRGLGISIFDVEQALADATPGRYGNMSSRLRVVDKGHDGRGDLYEITNRNGDHPVCLAVQVDIRLGSGEPAFPTTDVTDGHCAP